MQRRYTSVGRWCHLRRRSCCHRTCSMCFHRCSCRLVPLDILLLWQQQSTSMWWEEHLWRTWTALLYTEVWSDWADNRQHCEDKRIIRTDFVWFWGVNCFRRKWMRWQKEMQRFSQNIYMNLSSGLPYHTYITDDCAFQEAQEDCRTMKILPQGFKYGYHGEGQFLYRSLRWRRSVSKRHCFQAMQCFIFIYPEGQCYTLGLTYLSKIYQIIFTRLQNSCAGARSDPHGAKTSSGDEIFARGALIPLLPSIQQQSSVRRVLTIRWLCG